MPLIQRYRTAANNRGFAPALTLHAWRAALSVALRELPAGSAVFTHFLVINAVVGELRGVDETLVFWPANASITTLERRAGQLELTQLGAEMATRVN